MQRSSARYRAGMPQLSLTGLSESWLLKECGHRHWEALAVDTGRAVPEFIADDGVRSYAAFTALSLRAQSLDGIDENDDFSIDTELCRVGPVRHFSRHRIVDAQQTVATLSMMSTFVNRTEAGNNRSVVRAAFKELAGDIKSVPDEAVEMTEAGKRFRKGGRRYETSARMSTLELPEAVEFLPCPNNDFNGADFLYFASFASFVDRAEWQTYRFPKPPVTVSRDVFYHGNINVGDALEVTFVARSVDSDDLAHWCEVKRLSDGQKIADVLTKKRWRRG
ncbi:Pnap_2097 family protein [Paraburkholderia sp. MM5477-R1]|uniref:Pnap_2097 family protein n=1 Tax=Paraburkholderia sp. MM5477-R1 TaxID=2991062 RepID=UPI003D21B72C